MELTTLTAPITPSELEWRVQSQTKDGQKIIVVHKSLSIMPTWFKSKYTYSEPIDDSTVGTRNQEFSRVKPKTCTLLVDAVSFTDAESRTYEYIPTNHTDSAITTIARQKYADVVQYDTGNDWYDVKVDFLVEDERTGKQKRQKTKMLVNADSNQEALQRVTESLKSALDPFEITHVDKTDILEVLFYSAPTN
ncbi:DUF4494 domain-containing protein [Spirosoma daeguense]